jgi:mono/diheme cytochrome c family protein
MKASCLVLVLMSIGRAAFAEDATASFGARVQPILNAYCTTCHGAEKQKAKLNLSGARTADQLSAERDRWFRVLDQVESGAMPPEDEKQPTKAELAALAAWVRGDLTAMLVARQREEGRSRLRRLSRTEYANTVYDLFGVRPTVTLNLPSDGRVDGYDKVSAALPMSAASAAGYVKMAEDVLRWVLRPVPQPKKSDPAGVGVSDFGPLDPARTVRAFARPSEQSRGHILELEDGVTKVSFNTDTTSCPVKYPGTRVPGIHRLRISAYGYQTDKSIAVGIYAGHTGAYPQLIELLKVIEVPPGPKPSIVEAEVYLRTGDVNDLAPVSDGIRLIPLGLGVQVPKNTQASACRGPGLALRWIDVEEPKLPLAGDRLVTADLPDAIAQELRTNKTAQLAASGAKPYRAKMSREDFLSATRATLKRLAGRFYRRDASEAELAAIMEDVAKQADAGVPLEAVFRDQIVAMMTSPDFLCVVEAPGSLSDFALATRLSYFLWNSTPDEALLDVARQGRLRDAKVLAAQTERLLNDPKSDRFVNDFTDQWLGLRAIDDTSPDGKLYPEYGRDDLLKRSSVMETRATFRRMLDENREVREFVAPTWAMVNEPLARHYGLPPVAGIEMRPVELPAGTPFGGLWTHSAILKVTANGTYTSPVKRGRWVSERLLGVPIPPPPPDVAAVDPDTRGAKTLREQLALHAANGSCAACHARFDPYGFALESFDVTGAFRTHYRKLDAELAAKPAAERKGRPLWCDGLPVDSTGKTPDGVPFSGIAELRGHLEKHPEQLAGGVTRHLITYATGAPPTQVDGPAIDAIVKRAAGDGYRLRAVVHALVQNELFRSK